MYIRIEDYNEWVKLFVDGKCVETAHSASSFVPTLLDLLRQAGVTVDEVDLQGDVKDPYGDEYQTEKWRDPESEW
jgi:hypothetical protein